MPEARGRRAADALLSIIAARPESEGTLPGQRATLHVLITLSAHSVRFLLLTSLTTTTQMQQCKMTLASMLHLHALPVSRETSSTRLFKALRDWCVACPAWQALSAPMDPAWWQHSAWRAVLPACAESRADCRAESRAAWRCVRPVALGTPSDGGQDALRGQAPGTSPDATRDFSASRASRELA